MSISQLLLWERSRPKTLEDIVLPERIRNHFKDGEVTQNYIFHGNYGTGKTSLAQILIGKYSKDKPFLEINTSLYTSINVLREEVDKFCKIVPMLESSGSTKYVFLDEFDRASAEYQDGLKAFIEHYKNVRFILVTNHFNRITDGIKSRFAELNFNPQNADEIKSMKIGIYKRMRDIAEKEEIEVDKETLTGIVNKKYPDNREMFKQLEILKLGNVDDGMVKIDNKLKTELYKLIYDANIDYPTTYNFLMNSFGPERIDELFNILGRPFIEISISQKKDVDKLFECNNIISDYRDKLDTKTDPIVLGMTIIGKFKKLLN